MKQLGSLIPILLLLGVGITSGLAAAELTASQQVQPAVAAVGETATVTLTLTYNGANATQVMVTPSLPSGIITDAPGAQTAALSPGSTVPINYPVRAVQSGSYLITSLISYTEEGMPRELRMGSEFSATGGSASSGHTSNPTMPSDPSSVPSMPQTVPGSMPGQMPQTTTPGPMHGPSTGPSMPSNSDSAPAPITPDQIPTPTSQPTQQSGNGSGSMPN